MSPSGSAEVLAAELGEGAMAVTGASQNDADIARLVEAAMAARVPMKRIGKVEEMAKTIAFLLSDDAGYITGQSLRVDGGLTRHI